MTQSNQLYWCPFQRCNLSNNALFMDTDAQFRPVIMRHWLLL